MGDLKLMDTKQIVNGVAILLSFYIGYKYALKKFEEKNSQNIRELAGQASGGVSRQSSARYFQNYKMVLVVRNDTKMSKGKIAAQCGHGAVGAYQKAIERMPGIVRAWDNTGSAKIALKVESEKELLDIKRAADVKNLNTCLIRDAGRTQIEPNTITVLAIGPGVVESIDEITGHLKLL